LTPLLPDLLLITLYLLATILVYMVFVHLVFVLVMKDILVIVAMKLNAEMVVQEMETVLVLDASAMQDFLDQVVFQLSALEKKLSLHQVEPFGITDMEMNICQTLIVHGE